MLARIDAKVEAGPGTIKNIHIFLYSSKTDEYSKEMNLNEVKQKIAETLQGSFENLYFDKTRVDIDQLTPLEVKRDFIDNFIRFRFNKIMTILEALPIDVSQYLIDIKIKKEDFIHLISDLYSTNVYERTQIIDGKKTPVCKHRWFRLCISDADCYHKQRFMVNVPPNVAPLEPRPEPVVSTNTIVNIPPIQPRPKLLNSSEPVISTNTMVNVPPYLAPLEPRPEPVISTNTVVNIPPIQPRPKLLNSSEPVISTNTMVNVPPYLAPLEPRPEPVISTNTVVNVPPLEPEPESKLQQKIKSKASLANILRDINELLLRFDNLAPAQQRIQNNYASVIKTNIVNLTIEDLYKLKYILDNGLSKDEFNHEFNENITTDIKPLGNRTERFIKILKTLPQREKRTVTEIFNLNQKGGKTRKRQKVRTPTKFYY